jgi:hypothetical protein
MMAKIIDVPLLFQLWHTDLKNDELAARIGVARGNLWHLRKKYGLPERKQRRTRPPAADPTPEEIAERCAAVRLGWSAEEEARRLCGKPDRWRPPHYTKFDQRNMTFSY